MSLTFKPVTTLCLPLPTTTAIMIYTIGMLVYIHELKLLSTSLSVPAELEQHDNGATALLRVTLRPIRFETHRPWSNVSLATTE
jgi:hypothetical protein